MSAKSPITLSIGFSTEATSKWTTDVSQFNLSWGKCYISPILDMNTNEIISYNLSTSRTWNKSRICYTRHLNAFPLCRVWSCTRIQGWQYQHAFYRANFKSMELFNLCPEKGNCYDNCIMETFFGRLKMKCSMVLRKDYPSFEAFSKAIADYIDYYNNSRIKLKLNGCLPLNSGKHP